ncbi:hypothetical protein CEN47_28730 [Fischerella thermalis CCMEE 5319]|nr:hypothetical protein CEN47_28730 [Fischerella thermalis CCMEE 5319]
MDMYSQNPQAQQVLSKIIEAKARISVAETIEQRDYHNALAEFYKWARRYELALQENRQDLISYAKFQMERHEAIAKRLAKLLGEQMPQLDTLKQNIKHQLGQIAKFNSDLTSKRGISNSEKQILSDIFQDTGSDIKSVDLTIIPSEIKELRKQLLDASLYQAQEEQPEDILENSIQETKNVIKLAIDRQSDLQQNYNRISNESKETHNTVFQALLDNDDNLALKAILDKKFQNEILNVIKIQLEQQKEVVELLKSNLSRLEKINKYLKS